MNLKYLNKSELDLRMKKLAQKERDVLHEVLLTIKEIDFRRTYLELGFGSLFDYLVKGIGYSEGSAQRRIDAARIIQEIPQIAEKIQSGELKLTQVSLIQRASREVLKSQSVKVSSEQKLQVIKEIFGKNHSESQHQVAAIFDLPILQVTRQKVQADESVRVELTLSKEAFAKIKQAQNLLSHAVQSQDLAQFLEYLSEKVIKQKTGISELNKSSSSASEKGKTNLGVDSNQQDELSAYETKSTATVAVKK